MLGGNEKEAVLAAPAGFYPGGFVPSFAGCQCSRPSLRQIGAVKAPRRSRMDLMSWAFTSKEAGREISAREESSAPSWTLDNQFGKGFAVRHGAPLLSNLAPASGSARVSGRNAPFLRRGKQEQDSFLMNNPIVDHTDTTALSALTLHPSPVAKFAQPTAARRMTLPASGRVLRKN